MLNFAGFWLGWVACVLGAANGQQWAGPAVAAVVLGSHAIIAPRSVRWWPIVPGAAVLGLLVDGTLNAAGAIRYEGLASAPWLPPPWLPALWILFASTLPGSLRWLLHRPLLAAALGAVAGPISYAGGARLGAINLGRPMAFSLTALAVAWGVSMPVMIAMVRGLEKERRAQVSDSQQTRSPRSGGTVAGTLAPCPSSPNCVSSEADPGDSHHVAPFELALPAADAWRLVRQVIEEQPRTRIVAYTERSLRAEFRSRIFRFVDDLELQLRVDEGIIAVRSASRIGYSDLGVNRKRIEALRAKLKDRAVIE
jgi:uncharacterized protein (DUF1499 family)